MSLAERLAELEQPRQFLCKYARTLQTLREVDDPEAVDRFERLVAEGTILPAAAAASLRGEDHPVSETVTRLHVRGRCACSTS